jgi:hypothetical protein
MGLSSASARGTLSSALNRALVSPEAKRLVPKPVLQQDCAELFPKNGATTQNHISQYPIPKAIYRYHITTT